VAPGQPGRPANYYTADTNPFGLFTRDGVPRKTFHAFRAFTALLATPIRLEASGGDPSRLALGRPEPGSGRADGS
jgi:hypothetical protein